MPRPVAPTLLLRLERSQKHRLSTHDTERGAFPLWNETEIVKRSSKFVKRAAQRRPTTIAAAKEKGEGGTIVSYMSLHRLTTALEAKLLNISGG